ncbi:hypothetical protein OV090_19690 [Nannocystis sp. RBIL2]|uniref:hypothetical protein n=1 Tax=Nannocystis sp. RBIL2 TaxID=2996788 RepID=UPI00226E4DFF|nr:hypothetical protein [Nannocystis sp. RBIL2]MCY1067004.1 hypothetical protein [Nannocystis sp. RBIL2]
MRTPLPATLWLRSKRPVASGAARIYVPMAVIAGALIFAPRGPVFWGLLAAAVLWFALFPVIVHGLLGPLERAVLAATPSTAQGLLDALRKQRRVRWFAPFAWTALQEGRLHLVRGEGRASAKALTEAARLAGVMGDPPAGIVSTQAHALLVADVPEQARDLLQALAKRQALGPWDQLHLAAAQLLAGKPRADEVRALLDAAQAALGATPRVLATRALLEQRAGASETALSALRGAEGGLEAGPDELAQALVERARRLLRPAAKASEKRARKLEARAADRKDVFLKDKDMAPGAGPKGQVAGKPAGGVKREDVARVATRAAAEARPASAAAPSGVVLALPEGPAVEAERSAEREAEKPRGKRNVRREERRAARRAAKAERRVPQRAPSTPARTAGRPVSKVAIGREDVASGGLKDRSGGAEAKRAATAGAGEVARAKAGEAVLGDRGAEVARAKVGGAPEAVLGDMSAEVVRKVGGATEVAREVTVGGSTAAGRSEAVLGDMSSEAVRKVDGATEVAREVTVGGSTAAGRGAAVLGDRGAEAVRETAAGGLTAAGRGEAVLGDRGAEVVREAEAGDASYGAVREDRAEQTGASSAAPAAGPAVLPVEAVGAGVPGARATGAAPSVGSLFGHLGAPSTSQAGSLSGAGRTSGPSPAAAGGKPPAFSVPLPKPAGAGGLPVGGALRPPPGLPSLAAKSPAPAVPGTSAAADILRPTGPSLSGSHVGAPAAGLAGTAGGAPTAPLLPSNPAVGGAPVPPVLTASPAAAGSAPVAPAVSRPSGPVAAPVAPTMPRPSGPLAAPVVPVVPLVAPPRVGQGAGLLPPVAQAPSVAPPVISSAPPPVAPVPGGEAPAAAADDAEWDSLLDALDDAPGPKPM